jgi:hypothetical protein
MENRSKTSNRKHFLEGSTVGNYLSLNTQCADSISPQHRSASPRYCGLISPVAFSYGYVEPGRSQYGIFDTFLTSPGLDMVLLYLWKCLQSAIFKMILSVGLVVVKSYTPPQTKKQMRINFMMYED